MFFARTSTKSGHKRHEALGETRIRAAREVFKLDPKAKSCSTARAHKQPDGQWFNTGSATLWHERIEIDQTPEY